jgi:hypothetical protein
MARRAKPDEAISGYFGSQILFEIASHTSLPWYRSPGQNTARNDVYVRPLPQFPAHLTFLLHGNTSNTEWRSGKPKETLLAPKLILTPYSFLISSMVFSVTNAAWLLCPTVITSGSMMISSMGIPIFAARSIMIPAAARRNAWSLRCGGSTCRSWKITEG